MKTSILQDIIVSTILFASACYILVINPVILQTAGFPAGHVFEATALAAGFGSIMIGWRSNSPSVVAPGMGLNAFVAGYVINEHLPAPFVSLVLIAEGALCALFVIRLGWRATIFQNLPTQVSTIITASIGGIIFSDAFVIGNFASTANKVQFTSSLSSVLSDPASPSHAIFLIVLGVTIVPFYTFHQLAHIRERSGKISSGNLFELTAAICLLASIPLTYFLATRYIPRNGGAPLGFLDTVGFGTVFSSLTTVSTWWPAVPSDWWVKIVPFVLTILFVQIMDISGTPFFLLQDEKNGKPDDFDARAQRGFVWESLSSLLSVFLQGSPSVCYAESNIAKNLKTVRGAPAIYCGVMFLIVAGVAYWSSPNLKQWASSVPTLCLSPLLAALGIIISGEALISGSQRADQSPLDLLQSRLPSILALVGAAIRGLTIGIAAGIVVEFIFVQIRRQSHASNPTFWFVSVLAVIYLGMVLTISTR